MVDGNAEPGECLLGAPPPGIALGISLLERASRDLQ
jgi:hypothetical protein